MVQQALDEGLAPQQILTEGLLPGMDRVGAKFRSNEIFVPEVLVAARDMSAGIEALKPLLAESGGVSKGKAVIGTVKGDLHDIGKNLVKMMIEVIEFEKRVEADNSDGTTTTKYIDG